MSLRSMLCIDSDKRRLRTQRIIHTQAKRIPNTERRRRYKIVTADTRKPNEQRQSAREFRIFIYFSIWIFSWAVAAGRMSCERSQR